MTTKPNLATDVRNFFSERQVRRHRALLAVERPPTVLNIGPSQTVNWASANSVTRS
ncbi:hypothetical protein ACTXJU_15470 [Glutamicibacter ardleyensis]|uniref:hypothetical protein n=1 Tax=Glutamicibacter ardleyensis TaxID=225894 RepID=UPI003FD3D587